VKISEVHPEGCIYEVYFVYNAKMRVHTNSSSAITKLGEMVGMGLLMFLIAAKKGGDNDLQENFRR